MAAKAWDAIRITAPELTAGRTEACAARPPETAPRTHGTSAAFRSNIPHRVTPVTRGLRKPWMILATGPECR